MAFVEPDAHCVADDTKLPCYKVRAAQNSKLRVASHLTFVSSQDELGANSQQYGLKRDLARKYHMPIFYGGAGIYIY